jgi:hypothetical protein
MDIEKKIFPGEQRASTDEISGRQILLDSIFSIPQEELLLNLGLFLDPKLLSRILFLNHVYQKIISLQGIIMDLGTRWGQSAAIMQTLRCIYEPYNYQRKIVAFDSFQGLVGNNSKDGKLSNFEGFISVDKNYQHQLENLLRAHEQLHPLNHMKKFEIVTGDVRTTVDNYIKTNPETIISMAFFDLDLYEPTKAALNAILPRLTKGSILIFDELNYPACPGETLALLECIDITQRQIQKFPYCSRLSFIEF